MAQFVSLLCLGEQMDAPRPPAPLLFKDQLCAAQQPEKTATPRRRGGRGSPRRVRGRGQWAGGGAWRFLSPTQLALSPSAAQQGAGAGAEGQCARSRITHDSPTCGCPESSSNSPTCPSCVQDKKEGRKGSEEASPALEMALCVCLWYWDLNSGPPLLGRRSTT
jgi:hypothetical protein